MAAREQQLSALLAQCSEDPAVVEAALQHGTLCKAARMFVLLNQLTANDVVAVVKQLAMDEQAAVKLWPPECIAWWNDSNKQRRMTARASYDRDRSWTGSWKYNAGSFPSIEELAARMVDSAASAAKITISLLDFNIQGAFRHVCIETEIKRKMKPARDFAWSQPWLPRLQQGSNLHSRSGLPETFFAVSSIMYFSTPIFKMQHV